MAHIQTDKSIKQELTRGCVVFMKASSGLKGYGNEQCISQVIGDDSISLFGHNEHYHTYDIREVKYYPSSHESEVRDRQEALDGLLHDLQNSHLKIRELIKENDMLRKQIVEADKSMNSYLKHFKK